MSEREHGNEGSEGTLVEEGRLREALRPARPDPEDFLRGVRERIAQGAPAQARRSPFALRGAAALLPPGLVREELLGASLGLTGKSGFAGLAGAVLVAPALALLAVLATFLFSLRRVSALGAGSRDQGEERWKEELNSLAILTSGSWALACAVAFLVCWFLAPTLTLSLLAVSMAGLALLVGRLGRRGLASRRVVGSVCGQLLLWFALFGLQFSAFHPDGYLASAVPAIFAVGSLGCTLLTLRSWSSLRRSADPEVKPALRPKQRSMWQTRPAHSRVNLVLMLLLTAYLVPLALQRPAGRPAWVRYVEGFDADSTSPHWATWSLVTGELERDGEPSPRLERVARGLHARLDRGEKVDPFTLRWAARAELLRPADWSACEDPAGFARLVGGSGPIPSVEQQQLPILAHARLHGLERDERERIVARLSASIPTEPVYAGVRQALVVVETLEALGEGAAVAASREAIHVQLSASWSATPRPRAATGFDRRVSGERRSSAAFFYTDTTLEALELAARVGLPGAVDPRKVRRFLEDAARDRHMFFLRSDYHIAAAVGLRRLEGLDLASAPDAAEWLARLRTLLPAALLALFCMIATALAADVRRDPSAAPWARTGPGPSE